MEIFREAKDLLEKGNLGESFRLLSEFLLTAQKSPGCVENSNLMADAYNTRGHIR